MENKTFAEGLASFTAREAAAAKNDPDRMGEMVERLAAALGFTVALAAEGDAELIDKLMVGAEAHAHAEAVERAPLVRLMRLKLPPTSSSSRDAGL